MPALANLLESYRNAAVTERDKDDDIVRSFAYELRLPSLTDPARRTVEMLRRTTTNTSALSSAPTILLASSAKPGTSMAWPILI